MLLIGIIGGIFLLYLWSHYTVATWFPMLARLSNMGFTADTAGIRLLFDRCGVAIALPLVVSAFVGLFADFVFNATFGTVVFREAPRELTFSARVKRHVGATNNSRRRNATAREWQAKLNAIMPGHI